jgi:hypothetical protein
LGTLSEADHGDHGGHPNHDAKERLS